MLYRKDKWKLSLHKSTASPTLIGLLLNINFSPLVETKTAIAKMNAQQIELAFSPPPGHQAASLNEIECESRGGKESCLFMALFLTKIVDILSEQCLNHSGSHLVQIRTMSFPNGKIQPLLMFS